MINHNKSLTEATDMAGVKTHLEYAIFQNHGYMGLYGGLKTKVFKKSLRKVRRF